MSDLAERLRAITYRYSGQHFLDPLSQEAATEIETLRARAEAAEALSAMMADAVVYQDSLGVIGSEWTQCAVCGSAGAPGRGDFKHDMGCPVAAAEANSTRWIKEHREEIEDAEVRAADLQRKLNEAVQALGACEGYMMNAKIDLETGAPKQTAIRTIDGGLKMVRAARAQKDDAAPSLPVQRGET